MKGRGKRKAYLYTYLRKGHGPMVTGGIGKFATVKKVIMEEKMKRRNN